MHKIGFIGVGIMGKSMVRNLMKAGYELHIYARTRAKVEDVTSEGAVFHETIGECVRSCDAVITIVGFPKDVEEVYYAPGNIMDSAAAGTYLIDMTTTSPTLAERIWTDGTARGFHVLDAPVTGGDTGAKAGTLSILVGGETADYETCHPLFEAMGTNINYQGKAGCGQHAKLANQIMIAGTLSGVCEALTYAKAKGLDLDVLLRSVATGAAGSKQLDAFGPKILANDYAPGFFLKHIVKDLTLADEEATASGVTLDVLETALANYKALEAAGYGDLGTQALIKHYLEPHAEKGTLTMGVVAGPTSIFVAGKVNDNYEETEAFLRQTLQGAGAAGIIPADEATAAMIAYQMGEDPEDPDASEDMAHGDTDDEDAQASKKAYVVQMLRDGYDIGNAAYFVGEDEAFVRAVMQENGIPE